MALPFFPPSFTLGILTLPLMKKCIQWNEHFHLFPSYQIPGMYRGDSTRATQMCVETAMYSILRARFFVQTLHSLRPAISRGNSPQLFVDCRAAKHLPGQPPQKRGCLPPPPAAYASAAVGKGATGDRTAA